MWSDVWHHSTIFKHILYMDVLELGSVDRVDSNLACETYSRYSQDITKSRYITRTSNVCSRPLQVCEDSSVKSNYGIAADSVLDVIKVH